MSKIIHLLAKNYNTNIALIEFHILFNVNDKSVDNIAELNKIKLYLQKNNNQQIKENLTKIVAVIGRVKVAPKLRIIILPAFRITKQKK